MSIEFNGLEIALDRLKTIADETKVKEAINKATLLLEAEAKKKAEKGELQQSIQSKVEDLTGTVYTPLFYAPYVEYGTGIFSDHPMGGRKEVPWVYVEGSGRTVGKKTIHTEESARKAVAYLRRKGLPAYSTSGQKPQPFMRPALDENRDEIVRILGKVLVEE